MAQYYYHRSDRGQPPIRGGPPLGYYGAPPWPYQPYPSYPQSQPQQNMDPQPEIPPQDISNAYYTSHRRPRPPRLKALLRPPLSGTSPSLRFDLQAPLTSLALRDHTSRNHRRYTRLPDDVLSEPATDPGAQIMQLQSDLLPWTITVEGRHGRNVTIGNVLNSLHNFLRHPISKSEAYIAAVSKMDAAKRHAQRRVARYPTREGWVADTRTLRVDWLRDTTVFLGLTASETRQTWKIHLASREHA